MHNLLIYLLIAAVSFAAGIALRRYVVYEAYQARDLAKRQVEFYRQQALDVETKLRLALQRQVQLTTADAKRAEGAVRGAAENAAAKI